MLGRFLELSLVVADTGTAWQRWLDLGFADAEVGDIWPHAYGVVAVEGVAIGLHAAGSEPLCITLVRPEVAALERTLADRLIGIERAQLGSEVFNLLELREPGGALLRVQEARSFSPPAELPARIGLGVFRTLSLPCPDLAEARGFWERLDYEVHERDEPWPSLAIQTLPLACHATSICREPLLIFSDSPGADAPDAVAADAGRADLPAGVAAGMLPALHARRHRLLHTPDGVALLGLSSP